MGLIKSQTTWIRFCVETLLVLIFLFYRYAGHGSYDDIIYHGSVEDLAFVAFYLKDDEVVATSSCGMDPVVSQFAELLAQNKKLRRADLTDDLLAWTKKKTE